MSAIAALTRRLAQARRHIARLEACADTDVLLDIPNRRGFERELNCSIAYVKRYRASAALLVVDVDRLKPINDNFGHAAGDHLLKTIVGILSANVRQSDVLGRLGGDEFGILLWHLGEGDALTKAAALERAVDETVCEYRGRRLLPGISDRRHGSRRRRPGGRGARARRPGDVCAQAGAARKAEARPQAMMSGVI